MRSSGGLLRMYSDVLLRRPPFPLIYLVGIRVIRRQVALQIAENMLNPNKIAQIRS